MCRTLKMALNAALHPPPQVECAFNCKQLHTWQKLRIWLVSVYLGLSVFPTWLAGVGYTGAILDVGWLSPEEKIIFKVS